MLDHEFMRLALGAGAVVGVLAPAVGFFLVQRGQSLIGDGIGHVAFAGVAAGILLDVAPVLAALAAAILGAVVIELLQAYGGTAGDQALALVFYTGIALGVVLVSAAGALNANLFQYLFGSILTVTRGDLALIAALGAVGLVTVVVVYRPLAAVVIDEEGARVAGVPIGMLNVAVGVLVAVTVALSMRVVGILLVAALMVLPGQRRRPDRLEHALRPDPLDGHRPRLGARRAHGLVLRRPASGWDDRPRRGRCVRRHSGTGSASRAAVVLRTRIRAAADDAATRRRHAQGVRVAVLFFVVLVASVGAASPRAAPDGAVRVKVYFPRGAAPTRCDRVFPLTRTVRTPSVLTGATRALLRGPTANERARGYGGWFSSRTAGRLRSVGVVRGVARIDFKDFSRLIPSASSSCGSALLLAQLDRTALQFPTVRRTVYSFDGSTQAFYEWLQRSPPSS